MFYDHIWAMRNELDLLNEGETAAGARVAEDTLVGAALRQTLAQRKPELTTAMDTFYEQNYPTVGTRHLPVVLDCLTAYQGGLT
jgi:hypothetical protein